MPAMLSSSKTAAALRTAARVSAESLLVLLMAAVALWILGRMWSVVWPLIVALFLTTMTWPSPASCGGADGRPPWPRPWSPSSSSWSSRASWR